MKLSELYAEWLLPTGQWFLEHPLSMLCAMLVPLILCAVLRRAYPGRPLLVLVAIPVMLSFGVLAESTFRYFVLLLDGLVLTAATLDLATTVGRKRISAERRVLRVASILKPHDVALTVSNRSWRSVRVVVRDDLPAEFEATPDEFSIRLRRRSRATLAYKFVAQARGKFQMEHVHLRIASLLGLWQTYLKPNVSSEIHVYPDMKQLGQYAVMARTNRLSLIGVKRTRKIGQDNEFERLRDYAQDDNYRHIDWRATARRNKLTVRDFQVNQSQRIIFLLDCGRMMTNRSEGLTLLDHALNAVLMMSYVALRQGDSVGLICFGDGVKRYVPPRGGMAQMNQLLHAGFDRFPELVESRYDQAFLYLNNYCPKRALVVLITNVIDEVNKLQVEQYLGSLVGRHLPMGVLLRDHELFDAVDHPTRTIEGVYEAAAAAEILTWRHQVLRDLEHRGVLSLDVFPEDMTAPLINRYLSIKARHLL